MRRTQRQRPSLECLQFACYVTREAGGDSLRITSTSGGYHSGTGFGAHVVGGMTLCTSESLGL